MNKPAGNMLREEPMRFDADQFLELAALPPLAELPGKIELVDGVIVQVSPAYNPHSKYQSDLFLALADVYRANPDLGWIVRVELSVRISDLTVRDADVMVLRDPGKRPGIIMPDSILMIAEVAVSTLNRDLVAKRIDYATAQIPHYWVVDVEGQQVVTFSHPENGDYSSRVETPLNGAIPVPETTAFITLD